MTDEEANAAYEAGQKARRRGMKQDACPAKYRAADRLFACWNDGWEDEDKDISK